MFFFSSAERVFYPQRADLRKLQEELDKEAAKHDMRSLWVFASYVGIYPPNFAPTAPDQTAPSNSIQVRSGNVEVTYSMEWLDSPVEIEVKKGSDRQDHTFLVFHQDNKRYVLNDGGELWVFLGYHGRQVEDLAELEMFSEAVKDSDNQQAIEFFSRYFPPK